MSKKTVKQRIALVAVSTLTAGVLSVISAPIANAGVGDVTANTLWLASTNSTTGVPIVTALGGDTAADKNTGFVAITSTTGTAQGIGTGQAGTVGTASMLPTGKLVFNTKGGAITDAVSLNVSGGTISSESVARIASSNVTRIVTTGLTTVVATGHGLTTGQIVLVTSAALADTGTYAVTVTDADTFTFVSDIKTAVASTAQAGTVRPAVTYDGLTSVVRSPGANPTLAAVVTPTGAVGTTMTVSAYKGASVTASSPTNGTLLGQWVITIVASGTSGIFSAADSSVAVQAAKAKGVACATTNAAYDDASSIANGAVGCILVNPKDAYGSAVTTGTITASATNGAKVLVSAANAAAGYLAAAPFSSATSAANLYVAVIQATANVGQSTVVTLTWNGVVIGTKTLNFQGDIAKLTLLTTGATASNTVYLNGATTSAPAGAVGKIFYSATDALGQAVTLTTAPTISDATGAMTPAVLNAGDGANAIGTIQSASTGFGFGTMTIVANPLLGAGTYRLKVTNAAGADIKTDVINATVSGGTASFTASWDKASYSPGESAILTISAKDSGGRPVAQGTAITGGVLTVNTNGLTSQTCPADIATSTFNKADGSRVCTFAVGNTAGSYSYSMSLTNSSGQSATTGSVKIVTSDVSNAEVLKSIVALIASINKQIAALQKLILKR
jgi:hypothetical protein